MTKIFKYLSAMFAVFFGSCAIIIVVGVLLSVPVNPELFVFFFGTTICFVLLTAIFKTLDEIIQDLK